MYKSLKTYLASSMAIAVTLLMFSGSMQAQGNMQGETSSQTDAKTVVDVVKSTNNVSEFAELLDKSGFAKVLDQQDGQFTVLAPKNEAIEDVDPQRKQNPQTLIQGQLYQGELSKDEVEAQMDVKVEETDNSAANGTVHVVDKLASPPQQQQQQQ